MLRLIHRPFGQAEWTDLISDFQDLSLIQTWEYGSAKFKTGSWKVERAVFMEGQHIVGAVQALVRTIPWLQGGLVWINRGPLWRRHEDTDCSILLEMMSRLRQHWVDERHMVLRVAPPNREGEVSLSALEGLGFRVDGSSSSWASARIDLSFPVDRLRQQLQQKWRNCLNKAERLGLAVESGSEDNLLRLFLDEYRQMIGERTLRTSVTPDLLSQLHALLPVERKPWVFATGQQGKTLGAVLIAKYGDTTEYLAGAINEDGRRVNAGQLLLWRAVCEMKRQGYRWFDLGGMDPKITPSGIYHFKAGLGGVPHRLVGEVAADDGGWISKVINLRIRRARKAAEN
ncbi:MAG: hypothetical protein A3G43_12900 [Ignavibacteria bacterium RIFCSPLOWO2_12_FULL_56_21]|nr:MAG: hypothetical protein A3G43_12900 [Ignavibacteria bacterium RIFCSPLOWO2_12_FULL_56_21]